MFDLLMWLTYS